MNILTYTSLFPNSIEPAHGIFIYQRMAHFARRGHRVTVIAPVPYYPNWAPSARSKYARIPRHEHIGDLEVFHPRYPLIPRISMRLHGFFMYLGSLRLAARLHQDRRFDGVDAHFVYPDGYAAVLLGEKLNLPVILSARGSDLNFFPEIASIRRLLRKALAASAGTIGVCTPLRDAMVRLGADPQRSVVIGNGVDVRRFSPVGGARRTLGIDTGEKLIVTVGALVPHKGQRLLLHALHRLGTAFGPPRLYVIGAGPDLAALKKLAADLQLMDRVEFLGFVSNDQLPLYFSAADLTCLVSSREGWANVLLESMACGTPVMATRVWGAPEVITSPAVGVLVEPTVESVTEGLRAALSKDWDREQIVEFATQRTWDTVASEVEAFFRFLLIEQRSELPR